MFKEIEGNLKKSVFKLKKRFLTTQQLGPTSPLTTQKGSNIFKKVDSDEIFTEKYMPNSGSEEDEERPMNGNSG